MTRAAPTGCRWHSACIIYIEMGAGILVAIAFFSLAGYIARIALRGSTGNDKHAERQRPLRHPAPAKKSEKRA